MDEKINENPKCDVIRENIEQENVVPGTSCIQTVEEIGGDPNLTISKEIKSEPMDMESFTKFSSGNSSFIAKTAIKDLIKCKTKFEVKLSTTQLKLEEANKHSDVLQNRIDEVRQDVQEMESRRELQNINIEMVIENFKAVPGVIKVLQDKHEEAVARLNEAVEKKRWFDEEMRRLELEDEVMKKRYRERKELLLKKVEEKKQWIANNRAIRRERMDEQKNKLLETRNRLKETVNKKNEIKNRVEDKRRKLEEMKEKKSALEVKKFELINIKEKRISVNKDLKLKLDIIKNDLETNKNLLKDSQETLTETNKVYNNSKIHLEVVKNKNIALSNIIRTNEEKLDSVRVDRQKELTDLKEVCKSYENQGEALKTQLTNIKNENEKLILKKDNYKKSLIELRENITSNKIILDDLKTKDYTESELLASSQADLEINKQQLTELTNLFESIQNKHKIIKQEYENKKNKFDIIENVKKELQKTKDTTSNVINEKEEFYKKSKEDLQKEFEKFVLEQESLIKSEVNILEEKNLQLKTLESKVEEINAKSTLKKQYADESYEKCNEIEKENIHLASVLQRMKTETRNVPSRASSKQFNQPTQRGILKSSQENLTANTAKKVTFEPTLREESVASQDSLDRLFKEFLGTDNVEEPKPAEDNFDDLTRRSPPEKDN